MCEENSCKGSGQTKDVAQKDTCVKNKRGLVQMVLDSIDTLSNSSIFCVWILDILILHFHTFCFYCIASDIIQMNTYSFTFLDISIRLFLNHNVVTVYTYKHIRVGPV